jgi:phage terminase Nu1 subunit (DNA packaging protein)
LLLFFEGLMEKSSTLDLEELTRRHPLPEGVADVVMNRGELAEFFDVSPGTITAWITAGMPVLSEGKQGQSYEFQASHCWAWKEARDADERTRSDEARAAIEAMRLKLIGGAPGDSIRALHPKERQQLYEVEAAFERLKRERNQSLNREDVRSAIEDLLSLVRDAISAYPDRFERDATFPAAAVDKAIEYGDQLLEELENRIETFFRDRPEQPAERTDLFN